MQTPDALLYGSTVPRPGSVNGISIREDVLYTNAKGQESRSIRKFAEKALAKLEEPLRRCLKPDETVLYVARVQSPASDIEKFTFGWMVYSLTTVHAVFTNQRALFFSVEPRGRWKRSLRAVPWSAVSTARVRGWLNRVVELTYRSSQKDKYWRLRGRDAKRLQALLPHLLEEHRGRVTEVEQSQAHCPDCFAALSAGVYECRQCGLIFKNESSMLKYALLLPGGGYFYTGNYGLAVLDFIAEAYLLVLLLVFALGALGDSTAVEAGEAVDPQAMALGAGFVLFLLAIEKLITIHHCRRFVREYLPTKNKSAMVQSMTAGR